VTLDNFLAAARAADVRLTFADGKLRLDGPPGAITPELLAAARTHKSALLASTAPYVLVQDHAGLPAVTSALAGAELVALDVETARAADADPDDPRDKSALDPRRARPRLLQLAPGDGRPVFLLDLFALPREALAPLWEALNGKPLVIHNALFDLSMLGALDFTPSGPVTCTLLLSQLLDGPRQKKGFHSLAELSTRELGEALDKG
jgi:ribonuclease D